MVTVEQTCLDFAERKLLLDCSKMTFQRIAEPPATFGGPGQLSRDEDGGIRFNVHLDERNFRAARAAVVPFRIGEVVSHASLFRLSVLT